MSDTRIVNSNNVYSDRFEWLFHGVTDYVLLDVEDTFRLNEKKERYPIKIFKIMITGYRDSEKLDGAIGNIPDNIVKLTEAEFDELNSSISRLPNGDTERGDPKEQKVFVNALVTDMLQVTFINGPTIDNIHRYEIIKSYDKYDAIKVKVSNREGAHVVVLTKDDFYLLSDDMDK